MKFYISDDLREVREAAKKNPNAQWRGKWCDADKVNPQYVDSDFCPFCGKAISLRKWREPREICLSNSRYPDRLAWHLMQPLVIAERVKTAFEQSGLTGIRKFIPLKVVKVARLKALDHQPPKYFCGEIDNLTTVKIDAKNSIIQGMDYHYCAHCSPLGKTVEKITNLVLDTSQWNGDDIFQVHLLGVVVTQRFYDFVQRHGFTNFNLVPIEEYKK